MFQAVKKSGTVIPGFNKKSFASFSREFFLGQRKFFVEAFEGRFQNHPLCGNINNLGLHHSTSTEARFNPGFPILKIQERGRQFGVAFYEERWMIWNDNTSWESIQDLWRNESFVEALGIATGFDYRAFHSWESCFPQVHYVPEESPGYFGKGYGQVWMMDYIKFQGRRLPMRWIWNPNGDPRFQGVLKLQLPLRLSATFSAHKSIGILFSQQVLEDALSHERFTLNCDDTREGILTDFAKEEEIIASGKKTWNKKFLFTTKTKDDQYQVPVKISSLIEKMRTETAGFIVVKASFERNTDTAIGMGKLFTEYLKTLLEKMTHVQLYEEV